MTHATSAYMEHGMCFAWEKPLVGLHVSSDILTGLAYFSLAAAMFFYISKRPTLLFRKIFLLFASFIILCGMCHLLAAWTVFYPHYWMEGWVKLTTMIVSVTTAVMLVPKIKTLIEMPDLVAVTEELQKQLKRQEDTQLYMALNAEVLSALNEPSDIDLAMVEVAGLIRMRTGFDAVGVRLKFEDDFPYVATGGFSEEFVLTENSLRSKDKFCYNPDGTIKLDCTCGMILQGKTEGLQDYCTPNGSFFVNDSTEILEIPPEHDPRHLPRNLCIHSGYHSVALIPIKDNNSIVGLLQINDKRHKAFKTDAIKSLELIAQYIGTALVRKHVEKENLMLEKQFQHAQKMESLGVLSGGIAHDFNNILAVVMGHCTLLRLRPQLAEDHIIQIEKASERAAELCRQMLAYAGKAETIQVPLDIKLIVEDMLHLLRTTIPQNIAINAKIEPVPAVIGDSGQIRQIVMNLIINASEAVGPKEQGQIDISLTEIQLHLVVTMVDKPDKDYLGNPIPPGEYVCLEVSDSGCGMNEETQKRLFEPFFTTKFTGRGLGMSAVLGIIKAHDGHLQFVSTVGEGTTFRVMFPSQKEARMRPTPEPEKVWKGTGTVLLVEDEEQVKYICTAMLEAFGFHVESVTNGRDALDWCVTHPFPELIITDLGMPVMDGYTLVEKLHEVGVTSRILVSSGFGLSDIKAQMNGHHIDGVVSKPFNFDQLRTVLKSVCQP